MKASLLIFACLLTLPAFAESGTTPSAAVTPEPSFLRLDIGQAKLNLLLQTWYIADSTSTTAKNNFRARRAETKISGSLSPEARWFIMIDPAKSLRTGAISATNDNKVLQDLGLQVEPLAGWETTIGQFKIPTVAEGIDSSADLPLPERSLLARTYGDKRQLGVQTSYKEKTWKLTAMYSNGGSANTDDTTNAKDFNARFDLMPFSGLGVGAWAGAADFRTGQNGKLGANARWKGERKLVRFEYARGSDTVAGVKTRAHGYTAEVGYSILTQLQPIFRFERFTPNSGNSTAAQASTVGLNYYLAKNNEKLQLAYLWANHMKGNFGSYTADTTIGTGRIFVLAFQMAI